MVALRRAIALQLTQKYGIAIVPEDASVGDSSGNGLAEHAVREIKAKTRSLAHALFRFLGIKLPTSHPTLTWLVAWAAMTINMGRRGLDGKTPWERRFGKTCRRFVADFGEKLLYLPTGKRRSLLDERFQYGIFLGVAMQSSDIIVGKPDGAVTVAKTFRRLPDSERRDVDV